MTEKQLEIKHKILSSKRTIQELELSTDSLNEFPIDEYEKETKKLCDLYRIWNSLNK